MATKLLPKQIPVAWAVLTVATALVLVVCSALSLLAWNSYSDALERARVRVSTSAQVVSTHIEWLIAAGLQALENADRLAGPDLGHISPEATTEFETLVQRLPKGIGLSLVDATGHVLLSTLQGDGGLRPEDGLDISKLEGSRDWYVSAMVMGDGTAAQTFLIAKGLRRNGKLAGGAVLTVPVSVMSVFWGSLDLGPGSTVGLMRDDGWLVARHPPADKPLNLSSYALFTEYLKKSPSGTYNARSPLDGETRIVGYRTVASAPLIVVASMSRGYALADLQSQMVRLALFLVPLVFGLGALAIWVAKLLKRDEAMRVSLAGAVEKNNLLMREIHHRTKNNLQSVASLVKLQPISDEAKGAMSSRIAAMSAVHEQAYRSDVYAEVNLREYLSLLISNIRKSACGDIAIENVLADLTIDHDLAQPLGLVVNEVISNAMKHAFSGRGRGRIDVSLAMTGTEIAELVIQDNGTGYNPSSADTGMGSRLISAFAQQLGDDYAYVNDNGTRFSIRFAAKPSIAD